MNLFPTLAAALCLGLACPIAWAARPFITDDARLTTSGSCQLESWTRRYRNSTEVWALPACNPTGNLELTLGGGRARTSGEPAITDYIVQAKTIFRELEPGGWGWGIAVGSVRHPAINTIANQLGNTYLYLPVSVSLANGRTVLHGNLGALRDIANNRYTTTAGLGVEHKASTSVLAIAEVFGDDRHRPYAQAGARLSIVPDRVQVDATFGQQIGGPSSSRWLSVGLRLTPDRLF